MTATPDQPQIKHESVGHHAFLVAAGIFLSRIFGLVRESVFAHYFGLSFAADAFRAALRIPNILQNLFGEGALSASFIPVYARLVAQHEKEEAGRVAGAVFSILALVMSALVLAGVLADQQRPVRAGLAATGEITIHGEIKPVGGIHEKIVAAHLAGFRTVLMPRRNLKEARALPLEV
ncbi:MAG: lipid II flippase MurJ, partial [bacterium]